jgi:hypothetical protein
MPVPPISMPSNRLGLFLTFCITVFKLGNNYGLGANREKISPRLGFHVNFKIIKRIPNTKAMLKRNAVVFALSLSAFLGLK